MSLSSNRSIPYFENPAGYKLRWPRPRTVGSGHGRSRRRRPWGTFARARAHGRYTIRRGYASVSFHARDAPSRCCLHARGAPSRCCLHARGAPSRCCLHARGAPSRSPLKAPSTRTRAKSCAIIAALDEISGLDANLPEFDPPERPSRRDRYCRRRRGYDGAAFRVRRVLLVLLVLPAGLACSHRPLL